jgi:hypothetical protein
VPKIPSTEMAVISDKQFQLATEGTGLTIASTHTCRLLMAGMVGLPVLKG